MTFLLWTWAGDQWKLITGQRITLKNMPPQRVVHLSLRYIHVTQSCDVHNKVHYQAISYPGLFGQRGNAYFPRWPKSQKTLGTRLTIKLNPDYLFIGHLTVASNALSLEENNARLATNQSAYTIVVI